MLVEYKEEGRMIDEEARTGVIDELINVLLKEHYAKTHRD